MKLHYGFLDESGILSISPGEGRYFVLVVLLVGSPTEIQDVFRVARKRGKKKYKVHRIFKAHKESPGFIKLVLTELAKRKVEIVIGVWDKRKAKRKLTKNEIYATLIAKTVRLGVELHPKLNLVIHKRYTHPAIRDAIDSKIIQTCTSAQFLSLRHNTEIERKELELVDAVAWACFQKYNRKDLQFYNLIEGKIKKESKLTA